MIMIMNKEYLHNQVMFTGVKTRNADYQYTFFPASCSPLIRFKVKARNDAHYMLSEYENPTGSQPYYEVRKPSDLSHVEFLKKMCLVMESLLKTKD